MARNNKYSEKLHKLIVASLRRGNLVIDACALAGITTVTFYRWLARGRNGEAPYDKFERDCAEAESKAVDDAIETVKEAVTVNKDWRAASWYLSKRRPEVFGDRIHVEGVFKQMAREMTAEQRQQLLEEAGYKRLEDESGPDDGSDT